MNENYFFKTTLTEHSKITYIKRPIPSQKITVSVKGDGEDCTVFIRGGVIDVDKFCQYTDYFFVGKYIEITETSIEGNFSINMPFRNIEITPINIPENSSVTLSFTTGATNES